MKRVRYEHIIVYFALFFSCFGVDAMADILKYRATLETQERVPREFIVKSKMIAGFAVQEFLTSKLAVSLESIQTFDTNSRFHLVRLQEGVDEAEFWSQMNTLSEVEYAEPNYVLRIVGSGIPSVMEESRIPSDPDFKHLWGLQNLGQDDAEGNSGILGSDIGATRAWNFTTGSKDVVVAVIDTGVDYGHEDLADNIYYNPGESGFGRETDGVDNDGNGFIDDHTGWNFSINTNDPMDDNGHGTHCSGTIGAVGDNEIGIAGVTWDVRIMPIKFLGASGSGTLAGAVQAIQYATGLGVDIMSNSYGGTVRAQSMEDAIREANEAGILFVAAAGNSGLNSDEVSHYPAGYDVENVIAVAATDNRDSMTSWSTFGKRTVDIAAPGNNIYSTLPADRYGFSSGTSMAAPHVAGALALLLSHDSSLGHLEAKDRILRSRDPRLNMARFVRHSGRLNVYNAINEIYPPSNEPKEEDWVDGEEAVVIESAHPYASNEDLTWVLQAKEDAKFIRLIFSRFELEKGFDVLTVTDSNGQEVDRMTGVFKEGAQKHSWYGTGNELHIHFTSDGSVEKWGFQITGYQYVPKD